MSQENVELIQRFYQQYLGTGEVPWDLVDQECELHDHDAPDQRGVYRGHAGVRRWLDDWSAAWAEWSIEPEEFIDADDCVVVFVRMHTKGLGSGVELDRPDATVYRCRNDKIIRTDYYNSREQALEAVGLSEEGAHSETEPAGTIRPGGTTEPPGTASSPD